MSNNTCPTCLSKKCEVDKDGGRWWCITCNGSGYVNPKCPGCEGTGKHKFKDARRYITDKCPTCKGTGTVQPKVDTTDYTDPDIDINPSPDPNFELGQDGEFHPKVSMDTDTTEDVWCPACNGNGYNHKPFHDTGAVTKLPPGANTQKPQPPTHNPDEDGWCLNDGCKWNTWNAESKPDCPVKLPHRAGTIQEQEDLLTPDTTDKWNGGWPDFVDATEPPKPQSSTDTTETYPTTPDSDERTVARKAIRGELKFLLAWARANETEGIKPTHENWEIMIEAELERLKENK